MTKVAIVGALLALVAMCFLAAIGFTAILIPLVTVAMLVALIAAGGLLNPRRPR